MRGTFLNANMDFMKCLVLLLCALTPVTGEYDGWGPWSGYSDCSRSCGGGVQRNTRTCLAGRSRDAKCQGSNVEYRSCNTQPCPDGSIDFRAYQCSTYNERTSGDAWEPHKDPYRPCTLKCRNQRGEVRTLRQQVVDGTSCDRVRSFGICISGICKRVGCDRTLGSNKREDRCLVCGGRGRYCDTVSGSTRTARLTANTFNDIVQFPANSTSIRITVSPPPPSALDLEDSSGEKLSLSNAKALFGHRRTAEFAGTSFYFSTRGSTQTFYARGPLKDTLKLKARFEYVKPEIEYEYSVGEDVTPQRDDSSRYIWVHGNWTTCSEKCGYGYRRRAVACMDRQRGLATDDDRCSQRGKPDAQETCTQGPCSDAGTGGYKWVQGRWSDCNVPCGVGKQTQEMLCVENGPNGTPAYVSESLCSRYVGKMPNYERACQGEDCPYWTTGSWGPCSVTCGYGRQTRQLYCQTDPEDESKPPVLVNFDQCDARRRPSDVKLCTQRACADGSNSRPNVTMNAGVSAEPDCERSRYGCCPDGKTPARGDRYQGCRESRRRPTVTRPQELVRASCEQSQYRCCPDGVTIARGPNYEGCPQLVGGCAGTRHGCCQDGRTSAQGPNKEGCPESRRMVGGCAGTRYGCCADLVTAARGHNKEGCPETRRPMVGGCAGTRYGCCQDRLTAARGEGGYGCPEYRESGCQQTRFGCCPDGVRAATGPDQEGCQRLLGGCAGTRYGCCPDGVTGARGENMFGCPKFDQASCALPRDTGKRCGRFQLRYFYDTKFGVCRKFWYGGCEGNPNRFASEEECKMSCITPPMPDACRLPNITGPCRGRSLRYFFNTTSSRCQSFQYSGCKNNANNFMSLSECRSACNGVVAEQPAEVGVARACDTMPCKNGFSCYDYPNGTYSCSCNPDWGDNCMGPPSYWCFSDSECGNGLKCVRERECRDGECSTYARCAASSARYSCDRAQCPRDKECVNDHSTREGYFCADRIQYQRPQAVVLGCALSKYGCCSDQVTAASGPANQGCPVHCRATRYGCCTDGVTIAEADHSNCEELAESSGSGIPCETTAHGCCEDGVTIRGIAGCPEDTVDPEKYMGPSVGGAGVTTATRPRASCSAPVVRGLCQDEYARRYRYDAEKMTCEFYWWGGCAAPDNVFSSKEECEAECIRTAVVTSTGGDDTDFVNVCDMRQDTGPCSGNLLRYYYSPQERRCRRFIYGGCQGNENNFETLSECQRECMSAEYRPETTTTTTTPAPRPVEPSGAKTVELSLKGPAEVDEGAEFMITCTAMGPTQVRLEWFINRVPVRSDPNIVMRQKDSVIDNGYKQVGELVIARARESDSGTYYCRAQREVGRLSVTVTPRIDVAPVVRIRATTTPRPATTTETPVSIESTISMRANSTIEEGMPLRITCFARATRRPRTIEWFFKGRLIEPSNQGDFEITSRTDTRDMRTLIGELTMAEATRNQSGTYYCRSRPNGDYKGINLRVEARRVVRPEPTDSSDPQEICGQPKVIGRCRAAIPRFYFDTISGTCKNFYYGGCDGNLNNFETIEACQRRCSSYLRRINEVIPEPEVTVGEVEEEKEEMTTGDEPDRCTLTRDKGGCNGYNIVWYYSTARSRCERFIYSGCQGNRNRFNTREECEAACPGRRQTVRPRPSRVRPTPVPQTTTTSAEPQITGRAACSLKRDPGTCGNWVLHYYYDNERQTCRSFYYGGCAGNNNRFTTLGECEAACGRRAPATVRPPRRRRCEYTRYGCCDDGITAAADWQQTNCRETNVVIGTGDRSRETEVMVRPGATALLRTSLQGDDVMWYRDNFLLEDSRHFRKHRNGSLELHHVTEEMAGLYTSRSSNSNNPQFERFRVKVTVPLTIIPGPSEVSVKPGESVSLHCQVTGSPAPRFSWNKEGQTLRSYGRFSVFGNGTLTILEAGEDDAGEYVCMANNGVSAPVRKGVRLMMKETIGVKIQRHRGVFMEGDSIKLSCVADGFPTPAIEWEKDDNTLSSGGKVVVSGGDLTVNAAALSDAGLYKCVAYNDQSTAEDMTTVQIKLHSPKTRCVDVMARTKCHLIVSGRLCGFRVFANRCCQSCRRAGQI